MITATHMLGLTAWESGMLCAPDRTDAARAAVCATIAARFAAIQAGGRLLARAYQSGRAPRRDLVRDTGRSFAYDDLAGDDQYIFLASTTARYVDQSRFPAAALYGWQFDAARLVTAHGALVSAGDLGGAYDDLIYEVCTEVAATLPRREPVSDADLAAFSARSGEIDPDLLAHIRAESTDPTDDLHAAVLGDTPTAPVPDVAVAQARALIAARIAALQRRRRVSGAAALDLLATGQDCEILVLHALDLAAAVAVIRAGVVADTHRAHTF